MLCNEAGPDKQWVRYVQKAISNQKKTPLRSFRFHCAYTASDPGGPSAARPHWMKSLLEDRADIVLQLHIPIPSCFTVFSSTLRSIPMFPLCLLAICPLLPLRFHLAIDILTTGYLPPGIRASPVPSTVYLATHHHLDMYFSIHCLTTISFSYTWQRFVLHHPKTRPHPTRS